MLRQTIITIHGPLEDVRSLCKEAATSLHQSPEPLRQSITPILYMTRQKAELIGQMRWDIEKASIQEERAKAKKQHEQWVKHHGGQVGHAKKYKHDAMRARHEPLPAAFGAGNRARRCELAQCVWYDPHGRLSGAS